MIARAIRQCDRGWYMMSVSDISDNSEVLEGCHLDSHADTCTAGANMVLLDGTVTRHVEVSQFSSDYKTMKNIPTGKNLPKLNSFSTLR